MSEKGTYGVYKWGIDVVFVCGYTDLQSSKDISQTSILDLLGFTHYIHVYLSISWVCSSYLHMF